ncbi:MAG TPA: lipoyl(octanoyl) transferase LipB [Balneolaceae bacterium]|nr:lipoyl(octanoyl) transferase LipB [Balneolaceae bacterium]
MDNRIELIDFGQMSYRKAWDIQRSIQKRLIDQKLAVRDNPKLKKKIPDSLIYVEHPHVYTLGKSGDGANLLKGIAELKEIDAEFIENDRGGDITYHGPGQIVGYPILDLDRYFTDVHKYLRYLEEVIIKTCADFGIEAGRVDGMTGVWVKGEKICAMGIRCSRWVTMHGFAFNVNTDLSYFDHIVPCGIPDKNVTGLNKLLGRQVNPEKVKSLITRHFSEQFDAVISDSSNKGDLIRELNGDHTS